MMIKNRRKKRRTNFSRRPGPGVARGRPYDEHDYSRNPRRGGVPRLFPLAVKTFKQSYIPISTDFTLNGNMSYSSVSGGLSGPSTAATGDGFFGLSFELASVPQFASFTTIFDQYKVEKWKIRFIPLNNVWQVSVNAGSNPTGFSGRLETAVDRDDQSTLTTAGQIMAYDTYRTEPPWVDHSRIFTPNCEMAMYQGGSASGIGFSDKFPYENNWIDAASTTVTHYGLKGRVASATAAANNVQSAWYVICTVWVSFRSTR